MLFLRHPRTVPAASLGTVVPHPNRLSYTVFITPTEAPVPLSRWLCCQNQQALFKGDAMFWAVPSPVPAEHPTTSRCFWGALQHTGRKTLNVATPTCRAQVPLLLPVSERNTADLQQQRAQGWKTKREITRQNHTRGSRTKSVRAGTNIWAERKVYVPHTKRGGECS